MSCAAGVKGNEEGTCDTECWEDMEQPELSFTTDRSLKCCDYLENSVAVFIKTGHLHII